MISEDRSEKNGLINEEQLKQIERYKWIASERAGRDLGNKAILDWIEKYALSFREWAESLPYYCVDCGECIGDTCTGMCQDPFNKNRLRFLGK